MRIQGNYVNNLARELSAESLYGISQSLPDELFDKFQNQIVANIGLLKESVFRVFSDNSWEAKEWKSKIRELEYALGLLEQKILKLDSPCTLNELIVFVGSSTEANFISKSLVSELIKKGIDARHWEVGSSLNDSIWTSVKKKIGGCHAGIFVFHPDEVVLKRNEVHVATRGNVLIEFGLATGMLGGRSFFAIPYEIDTARLEIALPKPDEISEIMESNKPITFDYPSDLNGILTAKYNHKSLAGIQSKSDLESTGESGVTELAAEFAKHFQESFF